MKDELIVFLAIDNILNDLDLEYEGLPEETVNLIESKVYESYGLKITSQESHVEEVRKLIVEDMHRYRKKLLKKLIPHEEI